MIVLLCVPFPGVGSINHFSLLFSNQIKWAEAVLLANQEAEPLPMPFTSHSPDSICLSSGNRDWKERKTTDLYWSGNGQMLKWGPVMDHQAPAGRQKSFEH